MKKKLVILALFLVSIAAYLYGESCAVLCPGPYLEGWSGT